jgi:hypothetical protein
VGGLYLTQIKSMRKLFILLLFLPVCGCAQMPGYVEMLRQFFKLYTYETPSDDLAQGLNFAKKKDGWYVQIIDRITEAVKTEQLFWSSTENNYRSLGLSLAYDTDYDTRIDNYFATNPNYQFYGYMHCTYYGYNRWAEDMIADFGGHTNSVLADSVIEGLGRAYSAIASKFLWYQYGGAGNETDSLKKMLQPLELPSQRRIDSVDYYLKKAIAEFSLLAAKYPSYLTIVGTSGAKLFNETFHAVMQMHLAGDSVRAKKFLDIIAPNETISKQAINYMDALPQNAILFTYGDMDTYPLLYFQESANYRKDITIVNTSLLGLPVYIDKLKKRNLKFSTTSDTYGGKSFSYFSYNEKLAENQTHTIADFIDIIQKKKYAGEIYPDGDTIYNYPSNLLRFKVNLEKFRNLTNQPNFTSEISIPLGNYLVNNEFMMLDIIQTNFYSRPVFFASQETLFSPYLQKEGILYRLLPLDSSKERQNRDISMQKSVNYINKHFRFNPTNDLSTGMAITSQNDGYIYSLFAEIATWYQDNGKDNEAKALLQKLNRGYNGKFPIQPQLASVAVGMLKVKDNNGVKILEELVKGLYDNYLHPKAESGYTGKQFVIDNIEFVKYNLLIMVKKSIVIDEIRKSLD